MNFNTGFAAILAFAFGHGALTAEPAPVIKIGGMCDRTGRTQVIGTEMCPGVADYIALVNKKGGVLGHKLKYTEIDHQYMVPRGAVIVEATRLAIRNHGLPVTGDKMRRAYEAVKNFDLQGLISPITITPQDHEGGGYLRVYQVKGNEWVPVSGWIRDYRDEVMALVRKANTK